MKLLQQKMIWLSPLFVLLIGLIFGLATLGSSVNPTPKDLPVTLVMSDKGMTVPSKGEMNYGNTIATSLLGTPAPGQPASPLKWSTATDEKAGLAQLDHEKSYALVVIPDNFTSQMLSLATGATDAPKIQIYVNQGKSYSASSVVSQVLTKTFDGVNAKLSEQLLQQLDQQGVTVQPDRVKLLAAPIQVGMETVNAVGDHSANGNAPASLTQISWMAALVGALLVHFSMKKLAFRTRRERAGTLLLQVLTGAVLSLVAGFGILWLANEAFGLQVPSFGETALFMSLNAFCYFLVMSAVYAWLDLAGMPIFMLLFFFSGPILTLAPEFLPDATKSLLYSWVPLRFSVEGLRDLFYFGQGINIKTPLLVLSCIGAGALIILLASILRGTKQIPQSSEAAVLSAVPE